MRYFFSLILLPIRLIILFYYYLRSALAKGNHVYLEIPSSFTDSQKSYLIRKIQGEADLPFFTEFISNLTLIRKESRVKYLSLLIPKMELGFSEIQTIYNELERIKKNGVSLIGFSEEGDLKSLFLLSICDKRYSSATSEFTSILPTIDSMFFGELAKKWNVKIDVYKSGAYKSFGEIFTRKNFSKEAKSNLKNLIDDLKNEIISPIRNNSGLNEKILQRPILNSEYLYELKFFNGLLEYDDFKLNYHFTNLDKLLKLNDNNLEKLQDDKQSKPNSKTLSLHSIEIRDKIKNFKFIIVKKSIIAILPMKGEISEGDKTDSELKSGVIERHSTIKILNELKENKNIKALVLHMDSPGGSAIDSEKIYLALKSFDRKIPVYTYISNTCASGGYYIACSSRKIYSNSIGIVGSIGTIMMRFDLEGLYKKFGIFKDRIGFYPQREIFTDSGSLSKESQNFLMQEIQRVENLFIKRVSEARKLDKSIFEKMGGGRVFSPKKFIDQKFIDKELSLTECLDEIKEDLSLKYTKINYLAPNFNLKIAFKKSIPFLKLLVDFEFRSLFKKLTELNNKNTKIKIYFMNPIITSIQNFIK
ncbi:MAG: signal peptide peptidase SppA [Leptospiraceae bacterium]|nr:signal peptide peptidase SppA [Leptospiraceae bacterium]